MKKSTVAFALACVGLVTVGCASKPTNLTASYVSPYKYSKYDCDQIFMEMDHVSHRTANLYANLDKEASNDAVQMGLGLVLFWPALFFLEGGDGPEAVEYSQLKGEYKALRTISVQKKCDIAMTPKSPEEIIKEYENEKKVSNEKASSFHDS